MNIDLTAILPAADLGGGASAASSGPSAAGQRFESLLNRANSDVYTESQPVAIKSSDRPVEMPQGLMSAANDLSTQMRAALEKPSWADKIDTERFPELDVAKAISAETRQLMILDMQVHFVSKSVEIAEKDLQTLYKQQG